jgi:tRNA G18 (ribose-2'-O)-methylase SpoU
MRKLKNSELQRKSVEEFKQAHKFPIIIVLDNVRSLNNIGSVFRTADAFLVEAIYLCGITATPPHRDIQKTALGATDTVSWKFFNTTIEAIETLRNRGFYIVSLEQVEGSVSLETFHPEPDRPYALVLGHEVRGVDQAIIDRSDLVLEIPQFGTKHSFNITVSAGMVLWHFYLKKKAAHE